jgi:hypothetical protein
METYQAELAIRRNGPPIGIAWPRNVIISGKDRNAQTLAEFPASPDARHFIVMPCKQPTFER